MRYIAIHLFNFARTDYFVSGLLVTGGRSAADDPRTIAEVILPSGQSCLLPRLPAPGRRDHTQSSLTTCGGSRGGTSGSCLTFRGEWEKSHSLTELRWNHVSWQSTAGTLLMGGGWGSNSRQSSELISTTTNASTPGFSLPYQIL